MLDAFKGSHETSHHGGGYAGICLGDPDIGELTISEMSPEDIRAELKRYVYDCVLFKFEYLIFFVCLFDGDLRRKTQNFNSMYGIALLTDCIHN